MNLTVKQFVDKYVQSSERFQVHSALGFAFEGTVDELYYSGESFLNNIVALVSVNNELLCLYYRD